MKMTSNLLANTFPLQNKLYVDTNNGKNNNITEKVLYQDKSTREILVMNQQRIVTNYTTISKNNEYPFNDGIAEVEKAIQQGESFEIAFRRRGYIIRKNILDVYIVSLRSWLRKDFNTIESFAKAKSVEFIIKRGEMIRNYAVITEVYSPDLHKAEITEKDRVQINFSFTSLQAAGFSKQEIWQLMDEERTSWLIPVRFEYI